MITLRLHSHAAEVLLLQRLLNQALQSDRTARWVDEDGAFGPLTEAALIHFQTTYRGPAGRLVADGVAGTQTWRALDLRDTILWPMAQLGQNTGMTCWVVAAGLATGRMTSSVPDTARYTTPLESVITGRAMGGLNPDLPNLDAYATENGMRLVNHVPLTTPEIIPHLRRGPAILIGIWRSGGKHAVVISGFYVGPTDFTTMLRIHNPAPIGRGSVDVTEYPLMTLQNTGFDPYALIVK